MRAAILLVWLLAGPAAAQTCLCLKCATGAFRSFSIASGSMKPFLEPGDCIIARTAFRTDEIAPGRVIVFQEDAAVFVFRVAAVGGQTLTMRGGRLVIDGNGVTTAPADAYLQVMQPEGRARALPRCPAPTASGETCEIPASLETLGSETYATLDLGESALDDTGIFVVPPGHVFVLGDNRDNALDSRAPKQRGGRGFVAVPDIIGIYEEHR